MSFPSRPVLARFAHAAPDRLKLPLDHAEAALRAAIAARLGIGAEDLIGFTVFRRSYDARKKSRDRADLHARRRGDRTRRRCSSACTGDRNVALAPDTALPLRRAGAGRPARAAGRDRHRPVRPVRRPGAGADGLPPDHPGARQGGARAHQGHLGPVAQAACSIPNRTCSSAKAAPARSPTASSTARSRTRSHHGRKVLTEFVKAGAPEEILYVSKPHIGTFRLVTMVEQHARDDRGAGRRDPLQQRVDDLLIETDGDRRAPRARRDAGRRRRSCAPTTSCWRSATARATPSRCCTSAACSSRPSRSRSAFASSIRSR